MTEHEPKPLRAFPTNWVAREDLIATRPDLAETLAALEDSEVEDIAGQIGERLAETYWLAMDILLSLRYGEAPANEYPETGAGNDT